LTQYEAVYKQHIRKITVHIITANKTNGLSYTV